MNVKKKKSTPKTSQNPKDMNTSSLIYPRFLICTITQNSSKNLRKNKISTLFEYLSIQPIWNLAITPIVFFQKLYLQNFCGRKLFINIHLSPQR